MLLNINKVIKIELRRKTKGTETILFEELRFRCLQKSEAY